MDSQTEPRSPRAIAGPCLRRNLPSRFPSQALQAGGLKPALLLRSSFRYFSLSLQSSWHLSIALLVPHRSLSMYRCSLRDTPEIQATIQSSPTQEDAAKDGKGHPGLPPRSEKLPYGSFTTHSGLQERLSRLLALQTSRLQRNTRHPEPSSVQPTPAWSSAWETPTTP